MVCFHFKFNSAKANSIQHSAHQPLLLAAGQAPPGPTSDSLIFDTFNSKEQSNIQN